MVDEAGECPTCGGDGVLAGCDLCREPDARCACCGVSKDKRDDYCETCSLARCDACPGDCPVTKWANKR